MKLYFRELHNKLLPAMQQNEAIFIFGARQCGKTTLLKQLMEEDAFQNSIYVDIEYPLMLETFSRGVDEVLNYLRIQRKDKHSRCFVFIDEVQYIKDLSQTIKLLVDHHSDEFKLVMTGSSSALIKYQFQESLVGRKIVFELYPLSFKEFLYFHQRDDLATLLSTESAELPLAYEKQLQDYASEYMVFGAYPKVVLSPGEAEKKRVLADLTSSYILKDIKDLFRIEKPEALNHLCRILAVTSGKECSLNGLSTEVGLHSRTLKDYLRILEECYVIRRLQPFYKNLSTELRKSPKFYFVDPGIRNALISNFLHLDQRGDRGELVEHFVLNNLQNQIDPHFGKINYWKTRNKQELDFIVDDMSRLYALECKVSGDRFVSFASFQNAYPKADCRVVCLREPNLSRRDRYIWQELL